jgi:hypothetical protein
MTTGAGGGLPYPMTPLSIPPVSPLSRQICLNKYQKVRLTEDNSYRHQAALVQLQPRDWAP